MFTTKTVDIIVPCYNEEDVLNLFYTETEKVLNKIENYAFRYIFVDDGSRDKTLSILKELAAKADNVFYISFARNFKKEAAMYAGLRLFGVWGMILAPLLTAGIKSVVRSE